MKEGQEFTFPVSINVTSWSLGTLSLRAALVYPEQRQATCGFICVNMSVNKDTLLKINLTQH